jgi:hypothetical protein
LRRWGRRIAGLPGSIPFYNGNGWVVRLTSHAMLLRSGLAWSQNRYKELLASADRQTVAGLEAFSACFLETAIEQFRFMAKLLRPVGLLSLIEGCCAAEIAAKRLEWGRVMEIANVKERQAREIVSRLVGMRVLRSESSRGPLRLHCPIDALEAWFPGLYPPFETLPETGVRVGPAWV